MLEKQSYAVQIYPDHLYSISFGKRSLKDKQMTNFIADVLFNYFMN